MQGYHKSSALQVTVTGTTAWLDRRYDGLGLQGVNGDANRIVSVASTTLEFSKGTDVRLIYSFYTANKVKYSHN